MVTENGIVKPYSDKVARFYGYTKEESKQAWNDVWCFINTIDVPSEIDKYKGNASCNHVILYDFMEYLNDKYPYNNGMFESIFDGISAFEFEEYIEYKYNIKTTEEIML